MGLSSYSGPIWYGDGSRQMVHRRWMFVVLLSSGMYPTVPDQLLLAAWQHRQMPLVILERSEAILFKYDDPGQRAHLSYPTTANVYDHPSWCFSALYCCHDDDDHHHHHHHHYHHHHYHHHRHSCPTDTYITADTAVGRMLARSGRSTAVSALPVVCNGCLGWRRWRRGHYE